MKIFKIILTLLVISISLPYLESLLPNSYFTIDPNGYILHFLAGISITTIGYYLLNKYTKQDKNKKILYSLLIGILTGVLKEIALDKITGGDVDVFDALFTIYGSSLLAVMLILKK